MKWILIIFLFGQGHAIGVVEFNDETSCMAAATVAISENADKAFCVTKGI